MTGFATVPDALRAVGRTTRNGVKTLRSTDCGSPVAELAGALPGSASAGAATDYARSWDAAFPAWCDDAGLHATNLIQAANSYQTTDQDNADKIDPTAGKLRGPH